jgi:hypothetical protein
MPASQWLRGSLYVSILPSQSWYEIVLCQVNV